VAVEAGEVELVTRAGAWFPDGCLPKWDFHDRPYFHGNHLELDVPAVPLTVTCARGLEFATAQATIIPEAGATAEVALEPARLHEPAARGWYGGDLNVHMNYSGDLVCGPSDVEGTAVLYHHLLSCGLRLAATVGTDVWLSFSRGPLFSNPPGWGRVYADLRGAPLSVAAFADAVRAGRTLATNGPFLELLVDGHGPGDVVQDVAGRRLAVTVRATGPGVERLELVGPDGVLAAAAEPGGGATPAIDTPVEADRSLWLCAVARGPGHPSVLGPVVFAHTSPVWVEVGGQPVRRPASARWLLDCWTASRPWSPSTAGSPTTASGPSSWP
jgi:hypothetical protein